MKQLLLILCCIAAPLARAQSPDKGFNFFFVAGATASQVHGDSYDGFHKLGFMGGIGTEYAFSKKTAASLGIQFIQKGARHNQDPDNNDFKAYYLQLNYVEVPLLLTYKQKRFLFDIGISAGYLVSFYEANEIAQITNTSFRNMEYSVKIGLGYQITDRFFANVRSSNSFVTIRPYQVPGKVFYNNFIAQKFNKGLYNNILEITLGYKIKPRKQANAKP